MNIYFKVVLLGPILGSFRELECVSSISLNHYFIFNISIEVYYSIIDYPSHFLFLVYMI